MDCRGGLPLHNEALGEPGLQGPRDYNQILQHLQSASVTQQGGALLGEGGVASPGRATPLSRHLPPLPGGLLMVVAVVGCQKMRNQCKDSTRQWTIHPEARVEGKMDNQKVRRLWCHVWTEETQKCKTDYVCRKFRLCCVCSPFV